MKLLILAGEFPPFRGGIATYAREIAEAAADLGHDVTVAAPSYFKDNEEADRTYPFRILRFRGGENTASGIVDKAMWTIKLAASEHFDVVHAADWPFFLPVAVSGFRRRARCLITFHGTEINQMHRRSRRIALALVRFWSGWALSIANSRYTADRLRRVFPEQRADRLRAVPLGVRPPRRLAMIKRSVARADIGLVDGDFVLLSLGRVVPRKGHHVTVAAIGNLPEAMRRQIVWYVVGPEIDQDYAARIKSEAAARGVRAIFAGGLPEDALERAFAAADLLCVPSVWGINGEFEGFGLVYIEAGLRGLPSVATTVGGIPDAVIDGETGILVAPDDPVALAHALARLWEDSALRAKMGAAAMDHACAATWTRVAASTYAAQ